MYRNGTLLLVGFIKDSPGDPTRIAKAPGIIACAKGMTEVARDAGLSRERL